MKSTYGWNVCQVQRFTQQDREYASVACTHGGLEVAMV